MGNTQQTCFIERVVPGESPDCLYLEHLARYKFASRFVANGDILDVACGAGYAAPLLCRAGAKSYRGVDISAEAIALAQTRYRTCEKITFLRDDACRLRTVADAAIDVAISFETVEHLLDPRSFLGHLRRVLRPGGVLILSTPNRYLFSPKNDLCNPPENPFHVHEWNQEELRGLLEEFFEIRQVLGQIVYPIHKAWILHQAGKRPWGRRLFQGYVAAKRLKSRLALYRQVSIPRDVIKVQSLGHWQSPAYFVCMAVPRHDAAPSA